MRNKDMSRFFYLSKRQKKSKKRKELKRVRIEILNLIIFSLIIISIISYLIQVNSLAIKGYYIKDLEKEITNFSQENEKLENLSLELQSMESLKSKLGQLNMTEAVKVDYLVSIPSEVVLRK